MTTDGKNTISRSSRTCTHEGLRERGPREISFRNYIFDIMNSPGTKEVFRATLMSIFLAKSKKSKNTSEMLLLYDTCKKIWEEFITIYKAEGLDKALEIIFTKYSED